MAYRWRGRFFEVDPDNPSAEGICDACGFRFNLKNMVWQYQFQGSTIPQNTRFLVCGRPSCLDELNAQDMPYILPPDPLPVFNARVENYTLDEASWLLTEDGEVITTEDDTYLGTAIPNPENVAATAHLQATISASGGSVAVAYLDIFNGNPLGSGRSVLADITGSPTRTNIAADLITTSGIAQNTDLLVITLESESTVNTNYLAIYDAATGGNILMSGILSVNGPSVTIGNPVVFSSMALNINLN